MSDIFLSYAREDLHRVRPLVEVLEEQGWSVYWDRYLSAGQRFDEVIEQELQEARCVLVLWSKSSIGSDWVRGEAEEGRDAKVLVPALLDPVKPPMSFRQLHTEDLSAWDGEAAAPSLRRLAEAVRRMLDQPPRQVGRSDDARVETVAARLHAADPLTMKVLVDGVQELFDRMAFKEPAWDFLRQEWNERLFVALRTYALLHEKRYRDFVRGRNEELAEIYGGLCFELYRYCDYLVDLCEGWGDLDPLREAAGDARALRQVLPEARKVEDLQNSDQVTLIEGARAEVLQKLKEFSAAASRIR